MIDVWLAEGQSINLYYNEYRVMRCHMKVFFALVVSSLLVWRVDADCCHYGKIDVYIECPTKPVCPVNFGDINCGKPTYSLHWEGRRCADGSSSSNADRCTDLSRPIKNKDFTVLGMRCNLNGCNCGWECRAGPPRSELMQDICKQDALRISPGRSIFSRRGSPPNDTIEESQEEKCISQTRDAYGTGTFDTPESIRDYFDCLDTNRNGLLERSEAGLGSNATIWNAMDKSGDGSIQPEEFDYKLGNESNVRALENSARVSSMGAPAAMMLLMVSMAWTGML